jgi:VWFA-related protein
MKTADRFCVSILRRTLAFFFLGLLLSSHGQENRSLPPTDGQKSGNEEKGFKIRIDVEEVRLDAVVLDKNGHQITDLTADDFEIQQNHFRQKITSCIYINDDRPRLQKTPVSSTDSRNAPPIPAASLTRADVRRTVVFVVDNLTMDFTEVHRARMGMRRFVETQMQEGDLVAIVPTAGGNATFQTFSSDKRQLLSMIDKVRWFIDMRTTQMTSQMMAMAYSIRTLQDMPGRKALIIISPATMIPADLIDKIGRATNNMKFAVEYTEDTFNPLADAALRAGVVIHTLDIRGLGGPPDINSENGFDTSLLDPKTGLLDPDLIPEIIPAKATKAVAIRDSQTPIPLSKKTGGIFIKDSNWFVNGIGPVQEELKGYYMLTYIPAPTTFRPESRNYYHQVQIKVKRPGSEVHARDGFFGIPEPVNAPANISSSLYTAIFSPFQYNDLKINLASGYIDDPQKGYLLQSSMHLNAKDLSITEGTNGSRLMTVEAASVTADVNNDIKDSNAQRYHFDFKEENIPWIREHGIKFMLKLPVKKPGAYYVRAAVRDPVSGKMGSAYQYIEIPDLNKHRLSLSNMFIINREEDLPWTASGAPEEFRKLLYPDMRMDPRKSPALRSYLPGETFECVAMIYNAKTSKGQKPDLASQFILYGNGNELFKSEPEAVDLSKVSDVTRIPIKIKLHLKESISPGDYVLLLQVKDNLADTKHNLASQSLDFKALAK